MPEVGYAQIFPRGLWATVLCVFSPARFAALAEEYDAAIPRVSPEPNARLAAARRVAGAFWFSSALTLGSIATGYALGRSLMLLSGTASASTAISVQILSVATVLVATLAARGWDIQTYGGVSLVERVNKWLTRGLFVLGTFFFSLFLGWSQ